MKKTIKIILKVSFIVVTVHILLIAILVGAEIAIMKANDRAAAFMEEYLVEVPLPENTEMVDIFHCACAYKYINDGALGYYSGMLVESDLSPEELAEYYETNGRFLGIGYFIVTKQTDPEFKRDTYRHTFNVDFTDGDYYIISVEDHRGEPYYVPFDLRSCK